MAEKIPQFINKYKDLEDKGFLWEMVKMEIRSFTITFTKTKAKKCRNQEKFLTKEAERQQIWWTVNQHLSTLNRNSKKSPLIDPEAHAFAVRQDGANVENEAPNTFSILKKGITRINVLPA